MAVESLESSALRWGGRRKEGGGEGDGRESTIACQARQR